MSTMKRLAGLFFFIALWPMVAAAEWQTKASVSGSIEDNVFRNSRQEKDAITEVDLHVGYALDWEKWSALASYEGKYISFADHAERNYLSPQITLAAQRNLEQKGWVRSGLRARTRMDRDVYALYDYHEVVGFVDAKLPGNNLMTLFTGYSLSSRRYNELEELDNLEHQLYAGLQLPLERGRTLAVYSELGYKQYLSPLDKGTTIVQGYRGRNTVTTATKKEFTNVGQWVNSLSVSTPVLDDKTGIRLSVKYRINFGDSNLLLSGMSADHYSENDLFDDRYGYESREVGVMVSRSLLYGVTARVGYDQAIKDYTETAHDISGNPVVTNPERNDNYRRLWTRIEKTVLLSGKGTQLRLYGEYQKIWNDSNDAFNHYNAASTTAGVELVF
ncbi:MAG: hypothetical protein WCH30_06480 [Chlorobiaceae bacterium]